MTEEEIAIRQKLKDNFIHYATRCLSIRTKAGDIKPFELNEAQKYIHSQLEMQKGQTGKVRALILKGRQMGCCYTPDMKILTADYRWVTLEDIQIGERIMAVDEELHPLKNSANRRNPRKMRVAIVEAKAYFFKEVFEVCLDNGAKVTVTAEHRHLSRQRGGDYTIWREVSKTKVGDYIRYITPPPQPTNTPYEDGWFGGLLDGEGSYRENPQIRISLTQTDGAVLRRAKKYLDDRGISYHEGIDSRQPSSKSKLGSKPVHCLAINKFTDMIRVLSDCRPSRFINKEIFDGHELPGKAIKGGGACWAKVVSIKPIGRNKVIDLQTSKKTYICEGLVSHNSTYVGGRFYHKTTYTRGTQCFILTHALDATNNLYKMAQRFYDNTPKLVQPEVSTNNSKELIFGRLDSGYKIGTAENKSVGRSSTIQLFHGSEVGFWANAAEHAKGILQAVPDAPGTEIILESTANGVGNYFHQMWQKAEAGLSDFIAIFVPWFWQPEYVREICPGFTPNEYEISLKDNYGLTNEQLNWRRFKVVDLSVNGQDGEKSFCQEYPCNANEAFQLTGENTFIDSSVVMRARKDEDAERYGPLLLGVDPARFGDDRTSIILRQGRVAFGLQSFVKKDTMEVTGIVVQLIKEHNPAKVFVDVGGLGAGVVDRLNELGYRDIVVPVNAGSKPLDGKKFLNKRAEVWALCKDWLNELPCKIPDVDSLHADLCGVKYSFDSNSRLVMERKEEMKKRGIRSSDEADALCLTFALPVTALAVKKTDNTFVKSISDEMNARLGYMGY